MSEEKDTTRRSVLKSAGVAMGAGATALAATGNATATHNEWNEGDIVSVDGGAPGWYTCTGDNWDDYIDGEPGTIVGGPCQDGSYKKWEVEMSSGGEVRWFNQDLLTNERDP